MTDPKASFVKKLEALTLTPEETEILESVKGELGRISTPSSDSSSLPFCRVP
jgi:hypothetical protein